MLSQEIRKLENENLVLKAALKDLERRMQSGESIKPKSCKYCKNFIQYYVKSSCSSTGYTEVYAGHCRCQVPIYKGKKRNPKPDDCCPYFELGEKEHQVIL